MAISGNGYTLTNISSSIFDSNSALMTPSAPLSESIADGGRQPSSAGPLQVTLALFEDAPLPLLPATWLMYVCACQQERYSNAQHWVTKYIWA